MANEDDSERSPFTRPAFLIAAVVVILIVAAGAVVIVLNTTRHDPSPTTEPTPTRSAAPTTEPSAAAGGASVCGLDGTEASASLTSAPAAKWAYENTTAYPTSNEFGPGDTTTEGVRFCFQHSPEGALFAATNAVAQGSDPSIASSWIEYFLAAAAPNRSQLVSDVSSASSSTSRLRVAGFRLLAYADSTARVEIAVRASGSGNAVYGSVIYNLVWEAGDWKLLPTDVNNPLQMTQLPDLAGYVAWGE